MENLDVHIVGIGNLGSSLVSGLNNANKDLSLYLYDQNPKLSSLHDLPVKNEIDSINTGVLILCIKPKDIQDFIKANINKISEDVLICTVLAGVEIKYL